MPRRLVCALVAGALIVVGGLVHGQWSERWRQSEELQAAAERLKQIPLRLGEWVGQDLEGDPQSFEQAGAKAYVLRRYTHAKSRASFLVIVMCGRAGRMAVHTPEVCYQGAGYEMKDRMQQVTIRSELGDELGEFWTARFARKEAVELRLFWAWATSGPWKAPADPRWQFRGEPFLYKLYVSHESYGSGHEGPATTFLRRLLPALQNSLFSHAS